MDEIFRLNNMDQIPEWFTSFMKEFQNNQKKMKSSTIEFQTSFIKLVKSFKQKQAKMSQIELNQQYEPQQHKGTI